MTNSNYTFTVTQLNAAINELFAQQLPMITVTGEISQLTKARSGHWYFTLKDAQEKLDVIMFRNANQAVDFDLKTGIKVQGQGSLNLYGPGGRLSLIVRKLTPAGLGDLKAKFDQLKQQLTAEGLFLPENKKPIPAPPTSVALVTSKQGAALRDIISTLQRRAPTTNVRLFASSVQGDKAVDELIAAFELVLAYNNFAKQPSDLVILARGGGSEEDLWCFNDERLIRFLANYPLPIISGVGHETDFTLTDFVSDFRAETPTAAAEKASDIQVQYINLLQDNTNRIPSLTKRIVHHKKAKLTLQSRLIQSPMQSIHQQLNALENLEKIIENAMSRKFDNLHTKLEFLSKLFTKKAETLTEYHPKLKNTQLILSNALKATLSKKTSSYKERCWKLKAFKQHYLASQSLQLVSKKLQTVFTHYIETKHRSLQRNQQTIELLGPYSILKRGYGIITDETGKVITNSTAMTPKLPIKITMQDGSTDATIN